MTLGEPFLDGDGDRYPDDDGTCTAALPDGGIDGSDDGGGRDGGPDLAPPPCGPYNRLEVLAGSGAPGSADGQGTAASFNGPFGIVVDSAGDLIVSDTENRALRRIDAQGNVTTLVSTGGKAFHLARRPGTDEIYAAVDTRVMLLERSPTASLLTYAGSGTPPDMGVIDGTLASSTFIWAVGLTIDPSSRMFVSEIGSPRIRAIDMIAKSVSTLAGTGVDGFKDGAGAEAQFREPTGVVSDGDRTLYVADELNHCLRAIDIPTGAVSTFAAECRERSNSDLPFDDGSRAVARFPRPLSITIHRGVMYVSDKSGVRTIVGDMVKHVEPTRTTLAGGSATVVGHPAQIAFRGCEMIVADFQTHRILRVTE